MQDHIRNPIDNRILSFTIRTDKLPRKNMSLKK
jgi:hypothetical protein